MFLQRNVSYFLICFICNSFFFRRGSCFAVRLFRNRNDFAYIRNYNNVRCLIGLNQNTPHPHAHLYWSLGPSVWWRPRGARRRSQLTSPPDRRRPLNASDVSSVRFPFKIVKIVISWRFCAFQSNPSAPSL